MTTSLLSDRIARSHATLGTAIWSLCNEIRTGALLPADERSARYTAARLARHAENVRRVNPEDPIARTIDEAVAKLRG